MNTRVGWSVLAVLTVVIIGSAIALVVMPVPANGPSGTAGEQFVSEKVKVVSPTQHAMVPKTFAVKGEARGTWFFEASFPVQVRDPANNLVGQGIAQATADWMTEAFVPFEATVTVPDYAGPADLVFVKDNPSGLPEHDDSVEFPIIVQ